MTSYAKRTALYVILIVIAAFFVLPFTWMVSTSFKTAEQTIAFPPELIPHPWTLRSFVDGFQNSPFMSYFRNSVLVTVSCVAGNIFSSVCVGFGFARLHSRFKNILFVLLLGTIMIPPAVTLIPVYVIYSKLGWVNTYIPLILPSFLGGTAFNVFLMRQFLLDIPKELEEAAKLDGCSLFGILLRIFIPISKPAIIIVAIFTFVTSWNDFFSPMIFLNDPDKFTVAVGLSLFKNSYGGAMDMGPLMALSLISIMPVLILFLVAQKYFIQGIATTGLK